MHTNPRDCIALDSLILQCVLSVR